MKARVLDASVEFIHQPFLKPMQISSGVIREITEARVSVRVHVDGREGTGTGSIYLSDFWSWPHPHLSHAERDQRMRQLCVRIAERLPEWSRPAAHPLELGLRLHKCLCVAGETNDPSPLAAGVCLSPFDAAIHDAVGHALNCSAFSFYEEPDVAPCAEPYFAPEGAIGAIRETLRSPVNHLDAWCVVSATDDLSTIFADTVRAAGYRQFKIKLLGEDIKADIAQTTRVFAAARQVGVADPCLSIDANEAYRDADQVEEFLFRLRADQPEAYTALEYLEQPTSRNILNHAHDWRKVAALKPVILDEGLTSLDLMPAAKRQGWSGFALKTCKGHSFTLVAAAWARLQGMLVTMQDLTNPGYAAIHSFLVAAHLPTLNGIELNSPQYTPEANAAWLPRRNDLFVVRDGKHSLPVNSIIGLGSDL